jgi:nucleotide-binding universal stress UspA family protein
MLKHVLVPLDGSPLAEEALEYARELVGSEGIITLLCAVEVDDALAYGPSLMPVVRASTPDYRHATDNVLPQVYAYLRAVADAPAMSRYCVEYQAHLGDAATTIIELADHLNVDAIVMSTHGRSGLGRWLFGSVTLKVLEGASRPVLVVPSSRKRRERQPLAQAEPGN